MSTPTVPDQITQSPPPAPRNSWRLAALIIGAVLLLGAGVGAGVFASSHSSSQASRVVVAQPAPVVVAPAPVVSTQAPIIINQNNNAPAPAPTQTQTVYQPVPVAAQPDPWTVAVAYMNDVNTPGGNWSAWSLLGPSARTGWNSYYSNFVIWADPTSFKNITDVGESGDAVTVTFDLTNGSTGSDVSYTCTFIVDNGLITSLSSYQN
jgi:hypothetical protein